MNGPWRGAGRARQGLGEVGLGGRDVLHHEPAGVPASGRRRGRGSKSQGENTQPD